jgi:putative endonuclease
MGSASRVGTARGAAARVRALLMRIAIPLAPRAVLWLARPGGEELGLIGEELAARALAAAGWRLLGRRVATPAGEVDVVARSGRLLIAVEVKAGRMPRFTVEALEPRGCQRDDVPARPGAEPRWRPADRVDAASIARQGQAARWLAACLGASHARVDVVEVQICGRRARVLHLPDVGEPPVRRVPAADEPWLRGAPGPSAQRGWDAPPLV